MTTEKQNPDKSDGPIPPELPVKIENDESMNGNITLGNTFDSLLKKPGAIINGLIEKESGKLISNLVLTALICLAVFGVIVGLFSGGNQLWAAPLKIVLGLLISGLITLPSLYIFSCLNGLDVTARSVAGVMAAAIGLISLLLLGLAPVVWIFSQSTDSAAFMGFLVLAFWMISLCFGLSLIFKSARMMGVKKRGHLAIWAMIFILVTFQMSTSIRPIIGKADTFLPKEKKFFLEHWVDELMDEEPRTASR